MDKPHKKLDVWAKAMCLTQEIYRVTAAYPDAEKFGLTSQMRRAAASVPANIAEGAARQTTKEYLQFLYIARGSLSELDTFLDLSERLAYVKKTEYEKVDLLMEQVSQILSGLIRSLSASRLAPRASPLPSPSSRPS